jgi:hypothetical protein
MKDYNMTDSLKELPNENYKKLFKKFEEINSLPVDKWNANHVLGYFVSKYKSQYNIDYKFKFNSPTPSKCFELFQIKRLSNFLSHDPVILKNYIDWVFQKKVIQAKRRLTSISFLNVENFLTEYKTTNPIVTPDLVISRATQLPEKFSNVFINTKLAYIKTYGDLAFAYEISEVVSEHEDLFRELKSLQFDFSLLTKVM